MLSSTKHCTNEPYEIFMKTKSTLRIPTNIHLTTNLLHDGLKLTLIILSTKNYTII